MIRLFTDDTLLQDGVIELTDKQSHYLCHVMRQQKGDNVCLFNGKDGQWLACINAVGKRKTELVCIKQVRMQTEEAPPDVWLCFAPIKKENMEFVIQKATELGVGTLVPVITERTVVKPNVDKMRLQAIEAAEQCERLTLPVIRPPVKLPEFVATFPKDRVLYTLNERGGGDCNISATASAAFLIGPEGGFTGTELHLLEKTKSLHFGERILRAETASVVALACYHQATCWKR